MDIVLKSKLIVVIIVVLMISGLAAGFNTYYKIKDYVSKRTIKKVGVTAILIGLVMFGVFLFVSLSDIAGAVVLVLGYISGTVGETMLYVEYLDI